VSARLLQCVRRHATMRAVKKTLARADILTSARMAAGMTSRARRPDPFA